jgi:methionyl-tRNA formyltransferase
MSGLKIVYLGTPEFSVPCLEMLTTLCFVEISAVVTHPDKPKGRNLILTPPPVKIIAEKKGLKLYQPERVSNNVFADILRSISPDLIVIVSFGEILKKEILSIPKIGCINVHASLLPKYRGAAPAVWALINGEKKTGVTTFWLSEKMDSGDMILQKEVNIVPEDTRGSLEERLSYEGAEILRETLKRINNGTVERVKQDNTAVTYAPKVSKKDGLVNFGDTAESIHNKIRAMNPWPGAYTFIKGKRIEIWESEFRDIFAAETPGMVVLLGEKGIGVATGKGLLIIKELQAEGKRRVKAKDFIHGYRINEGFIFS